MKKRVISVIGLISCILILAAGSVWAGEKKFGTTVVTNEWEEVIFMNDDCVTVPMSETTMRFDNCPFEYIEK